MVGEVGAVFEWVDTFSTSMMADSLSVGVGGWYGTHTMETLCCVERFELACPLVDGCGSCAWLMRSAGVTIVPSGSEWVMRLGVCATETGAVLVMGVTLDMALRTGGLVMVTRLGMHARGVFV